MKKRQLLTATGINLLAYVNNTLITERRRGVDGSVDLPPLRALAAGAVHENTVLQVEQDVPVPSLGETA